jgi:cytosine/adenosine deaminase-related metal-dependent hydrolase
MQINNVRLFTGDTVSISVARDKIDSVSNPVTSNDAFRLEFHDAIAFPGLINSHDHLDFNLFPRLGTSTYNNYTEWGSFIHKEYKKEIADVLKIPEALRTSWGIYKNLLCGITTVVNHGKKLEVLNPLITVIQQTHDIHSVRFERFWKLKLNNPFKNNIPCVVHSGEGTDTAAEQEIDKLLKWNLFKRKLIGIHGVAMSPEQAAGFNALVWCPVSNYFLLQQTADINRLKKKTKICFGTDSTLTAGWNLWEHLRYARKSTVIKETELFDMLTAIPAAVWKLNSGGIAVGKDADIVIARAKSTSGFFSIDPQDILLVMHNGVIRLFDEELLPQLKAADFDLHHFFKIRINKEIKYVHGNLPKLVSLIKSYYPGADLPVNVSENLKYAS